MAFAVAFRAVGARTQAQPCGPVLALLLPSEIRVHQAWVMVSHGSIELSIDSRPQFCKSMKTGYIVGSFRHKSLQALSNIWRPITKGCVDVYYISYYDI